MDQEFSLRLAQMRESNPGEPKEGLAIIDASTFELFTVPGHIRFLDMVWPDGRRESRCYTFLIGQRLFKEAEGITIHLSFTSDTVQIKGFGLEIMYRHILDQTLREVSVIDPRYLVLMEKEGPLITEITFGPACS